MKCEGDTASDHQNQRKTGAEGCLAGVARAVLRTAIADPHLYVLLIADGHHYKLSASATRAEPHIYKSTIARREYLEQWAITRTGLRPELMGLLMFITWVLCFASVASADGLSIPSTWRVRLRY
jgi:hypothetical protein